MSKYPLCEAAGLFPSVHLTHKVIPADDVEHYLRNLGKNQPNLGDKEQDVKQPEMTYKAHMEWAAKQFDEPKEHGVELGDLAFTESDCDIDVHWTMTYGVVGCKQQETINPVKYLSVAVANRILREKLSRAPVVYWQHGGAMHDVQNSLDTHQARLVCVTPIAKADTADEFLRDLAEYANNQHTLTDLTARARALLAKGGE